MPAIEPHKLVERLLDFQSRVRDVVRASHAREGLAEVAHVGAADTIYKIDADVDPILIDFCEHLSREIPLVLVAEGVHDEHGREAPRVFPAGTDARDAELRLIVDPIDGTRGIMYDKRPAWSLAGLARNRGEATRLRDIEVAVMTELPTSKMGRADQLWAIRGGGAHGRRVDLDTGLHTPLVLRPSRATSIDHGFASVVNFFPGTKRLASELMEHIAHALLGPADVTRAAVFDDQYICTGGQFHELIVGHDRFIADLRPLLYKLLGQPEGLCCHPYDCATMLIAEEAGVVLTDAAGAPLDGPLDVTTGLSWVGYANPTLRSKIEPVLHECIQKMQPHRAVFAPNPIA